MKNLGGDSFRKKIDEILLRDDFTKNEKVVFNEYFGFGGEPKTAREIRKMFQKQISSQAVYQFKNSAIQKIRLVLSTP